MECIKKDLKNSLRKDPFNKGNIEEALGFGIPTPEIQSEITSALESKIGRWTQEAGNTKGEISFNYILDYVLNLKYLTEVLNSYGIHTYMEFL